MSVVNCARCKSPDTFGCVELDCPEGAPVARPSTDDRLRALQAWLRTEDRGSEYDAEAVADLIDEWISR